jgi:tRNA(Ile)-lysidine synthase
VVETCIAVVNLRQSVIIAGVQDILLKFEATIRRHALLPERGCVVLAVSGGPDSLALLHLMREVRDRSFPRLALHVGHLHHGMRGATADEDARFVASEAARLGLGCTIERADVPGLAAVRRLGVEVAGREARYQFLTQLAKSVGAGEIAFGHQADDQAETVLMRVIRGAGPRGMGGIPYVREIADAPEIRVIRPLLDCTRREVVRFLRQRGLHPRLDSTNLSRKYLRNRLRRLAIPEMKREWGAALTADLCSLAALAQRFQARSDAMRAELQSRHSVRIMDGYVETEAGWLRRTPPAMLPDCVQGWMKEAGLWRKMLSAKEYERIAALLERGRGRVALSGGALACVWRGLFILCPAPAAAPAKMEYGVRLEVPGHTRIEPLDAVIEAEILRSDTGRCGAVERVVGRGRPTYEQPKIPRKSCRSAALGRQIPVMAGLFQQSLCPHDSHSFPQAGLEEFLDLEKVELPLVARFARPGDRMRPLGAPGSRKLQDIFTDLHVPPWLRTRTLVVTMQAPQQSAPLHAAGQALQQSQRLHAAGQDRPIWIVGCRIADAVKLTDRTRKALRLKFLPKA